MKKYLVLLLIIMVAASLAACGGSDPEPTATLPPPGQAIIVTTTPVPSGAEDGDNGVVIDLPELPTSTPTPVIPTMAPPTVTAVHVTIEAGQATETAVPEANNGERVNATQAPDQAPVITSFFASSAPEGSGIRYYLNYDVVNANQVEIFGHVMENPQTGSWPVYNDSDQWVLWAANDATWVESQLQFQPDYDTGSRLTDVTLSSNETTVCIKDPQFVDGDKIHIIANGRLALNNFQTGGRDICGTANFPSGAHTVEVQVTSEGQTPLAVVQVTLSNVASGPAAQISQALKTNEVARFTVVAP